MLLFNKKDGDIFNLDNIVRIYPDGNQVRFCDNRTYGDIMVVCDDSNQAINVVEKIYHRMTYGSGNMILDLEEFRKKETETAKTRRILRNNCNTCIYVDTDGCKEWDNDGTGCYAHITEEEALQDVNKEK